MWKLGVQVRITVNRKIQGSIQLHMWQLLVPPESLWSIPGNLTLLLQKVLPETELGMDAWDMNGATDYTVSLNT